MATFYKLYYELQLHPAYLPDLARCDHFPFPNTKKQLCGTKFGSNEEGITKTNPYFERYENRKNWTKRIKLRGDNGDK